MTQVEMVDPLMPRECYLLNDDDDGSNPLPSKYIDADGSGSGLESLCAQYQGTHGNYNFIQSLYWAVATGTTVGFGDLSPKNNEGKWFCIVYLPIVIVAFVNFVGAMQAKMKGEGSLTDILGYGARFLVEICTRGHAIGSHDCWG
jgi:hypothetical protein